MSAAAAWERLRRLLTPSIWYWRPEHFTNVLTPSMQRAQKSAVSQLLEEGRASGAWDDGTVHALDTFIAARKQQLIRRLDDQQTEGEKVGALLVARLAGQIERRAQRISYLEAEIRRLDFRVSRAEAELIGGTEPAADEGRQPVSVESRHLDHHGLRKAGDARWVGFSQGPENTLLRS